MENTVDCKIISMEKYFHVTVLFSKVKMTKKRLKRRVVDWKNMVKKNPETAKRTR